MGGGGSREAQPRAPSTADSLSVPTHCTQDPGCVPGRAPGPCYPPVYYLSISVEVALQKRQGPRESGDLFTRDVYKGPRQPGVEVAQGTGQ